MKYLLGSGYYHGPVPPAKDGCGRIDQYEFSKLWWLNLSQHTPSLNHKPVVLCVGGSQVPQVISDECRVLSLVGTAGHVSESGSKGYEVSGSTSNILALCWLAYSNETDLLYREQDTLCFGPWVEQMYADLGDGGVLCEWDAAMQKHDGSLMLIRHSFIPQFTRDWLAFRPEKIPDHLAEHKLDKMVKRAPKQYRVASFGYDRARPFNTDDKVFFIQQPSQSDVDLLRAKSMM